MRKESEGPVSPIAILRETGIRVLRLHASNPGQPSGNADQLPMLDGTGFDSIEQCLSLYPRKAELHSVTMKESALEIGRCRGAEVVICSRFKIKGLPILVVSKLTCRIMNTDLGFTGHGCTKFLKSSVVVKLQHAGGCIANEAHLHIGGSKSCESGYQIILLRRLLLLGQSSPPGSWRCIAVDQLVTRQYHM